MKPGSKPDEIFLDSWLEGIELIDFHSDAELKACLDKLNSISFDISLTYILFLSLVQYARKNGILEIEKIIEQIDDDFLKSGLQLVVDGCDPEVLTEVLDNYTIKLKNDYTNYLDLCKLGIKHIQLGTNPAIVQTLLKTKLN